MKYRIFAFSGVTIVHVINVVNSFLYDFHGKVLQTQTYFQDGLTYVIITVTMEGSWLMIDDLQDIRNFINDIVEHNKGKSVTYSSSYYAHVAECNEDDAREVLDQLADEGILISELACNEWLYTQKG